MIRDYLKLQPYLFFFGEFGGVFPIVVYNMADLTQHNTHRGFNATLSYLAFMKFFRRVKKHVSVSAFILFFTII